MRNTVVFRSALICGVLALAGYMYVMARTSLALDKESSAFAQNTVTAVGAHWDAAELWQRATPHFREQTSQEELRAQFDAANGRLGPMTEPLSIAGKSLVPDHPDQRAALRRLHRAFGVCQRRSRHRRPHRQDRDRLGHRQLQHRRIAGNAQAARPARLTLERNR